MRSPEISLAQLEDKAEALPAAPTAPAFATGQLSTALSAMGVAARLAAGAWQAAAAVVPNFLANASAAAPAADSANAPASAPAADSAAAAMKPGKRLAPELLPQGKQKKV